MNDSKVFQCDITDKDSIRSVLHKVCPDYVINFAGISFVNTKDRDLFYKVNVIAVENLLEVICGDGVNIKKMILPSSATVYGNQAHNILDESMCPKPVNHYGMSKLNMEHVAARFFDKLNIIIARPFNYTGLWQEKHFVIPKIVAHYKDKKSRIELGNMNVRREFNDVEYVCGIYERLLLSDIRSETVNICSGRTIPLTDVISIMDRLAGYNIEVKVNPDFVRANEIDSLSGSVEKLKSLIKLPEMPSFEETLMKMYIGE